MATAKRQASGSMLERVRLAPFIFTAQVVKQSATTVAALQPDERLVIVKVEQVFRAPAVLGSLEKKRITVRLASDRPLKVGSKTLFYATSWLFGEGIAVVELGRDKAPADRVAMLASVARSELQLEEDRLAVRVRSADLVISGWVDRTEPVEGSQRRGLRSEHEPLWWRADIAIEHTEKGRSTDARQVAFFPSSLDEFWLDVPKLQAGQRGVFILHRKTEGKRASMQPPGPALLDALDFQASAHVARVRALLKLVSA